MAPSVGTIEVGSLRHMLKTNTKQIHDVADKAMRAFLFEDDHTTSLPAYRHFLLQLYVLYEAMETELAKLSEHPLVGPIHFAQELNRLKYLEMDLDYFYDGKWRDILQDNITDGMRRYADRVRYAAKTQPELLIAHSYTRYLGDMSGGQILKKMIKKRYDLKNEDGLNFYCFDHVESIGKLKELYSARMNSLDLTETQKNDLVDEAKHIFQFNIDVFNEVGERFKPGSNYNENNHSNVKQSEQCVPSDRQCVNDDYYDMWNPNIVKITVGASAVILALCPWFRGMLLKSIA